MTDTPTARTSEQARDLADDANDFADDVIIPTLRKLIAERFPNEDDQRDVFATTAGDIIFEAVREAPEKIDALRTMVDQSFVVATFAALLDHVAESQAS